MLAPATIRAIVRFDLTEPVTLPAGLVVLTSARICDAEVDVWRFPAIREDHPERVFYLYPKAVLPLSLFLARQPSSQFWFIVHRARWIRGQSDCFLADPWKGDAGPRPFRFESEGEVFYYLQEHEIKRQSVLLGRMGLKQAGGFGDLQNHDPSTHDPSEDRKATEKSLALAHEIARHFKELSEGTGSGGLMAEQS